MTAVQEKHLERVVGRQRRPMWRSGPHGLLDRHFEIVSEVRLMRPSALMDVLDRMPARSPESGASLVTYTVRGTDGPEPEVALFHEQSLLAVGRCADDLVAALLAHVNEAELELIADRAVVLPSWTALRGGMTVVVLCDPVGPGGEILRELAREGFECVSGDALVVDACTKDLRPLPGGVRIHVATEAGHEAIAPMDREPLLRASSRAGGQGRKETLRVPPPRLFLFPRLEPARSPEVCPVERGAAHALLLARLSGAGRHGRRNETVLWELLESSGVFSVVASSPLAVASLAEQLVSERLWEDL